jgi:hypothetical protein
MGNAMIPTMLSRLATSAIDRAIAVAFPMVSWGLKSIRRTLCLRALGWLTAGAAIMLAAAPDAKAETCRGKNFVDSLSVFANGTARATSSDGETYDRIESGNFDADFRINLCGDGAIDGVILHLGQCTGHRRGCDTAPIMYQEFPSARDLGKRVFFSFAIPPGSAAGQSILATCNANAGEQRGAASDKEIFPGFFGVTLGVDTRRDTSKLGGDATGFDPSGSRGVVDPARHKPLGEYSKTAAGTLTLRVLCAPLPQAIRAPPKITDAALGVTTSGDTCPKPATAEVLIAAEEPRAVFYKIERGNGTTTTPDWIQGRIKRQQGLMGAESAFLLAEHDLGGLDPGERRFRLWIDGWGKTPWQPVEVDCPPFKVTSAWLKYEVEGKPTCPKDVAETATFRATRPGKAPFEIQTQGGLVVHSGTAVFEREGMGYVAEIRRPNLSMSAFDQEMMALITSQPDANSGWVRLKVQCLEVLSGTLDLRKLAATACEGEVALSVRATMPGPVPYQLDCTGGRSWSGTAEVPKTGPDTFIGVDTKRFDVKNNEHVNCALKTRAPMLVEVLALKGDTYQCHKPSDATGSFDLEPEKPSDPVQLCPPGFTWNGERCDRIGTPPQICPRGWTPTTVNGECCPPGRPWTGQQCGRDTPPECPKGHRGAYPDCKPETPQCNRIARCLGSMTWSIEQCKCVCPQGHVNRRGRCVPGEQNCAPGTAGSPPNCRVIDPRSCPSGFVGNPPNCRREVCPPGTRGRPPRCLPVAKECQKGYVGAPPNCRKAVVDPPRKCPPGKVGRFPRCRPVMRACPFGMIGRPPKCRRISGTPQGSGPGRPVARFPGGRTHPQVR